MNANELADLLEVDSWYKLVTREEIAIMLRQQQVLIENLNGRIERMIEKQSHYESMAHAGGFEAGRELGMKQERESNNEPVAWMREDGVIAFHKQKEVDSQGYKWQPLYTHPVKEQDTDCQYCKQGCIRCDARKQLTDEEITQCLNESMDIKGVWGQPMMELNPVNFARAILRKASEK